MMAVSIPLLSYRPFPFPENSSFSVTVVGVSISFVFAHDPKKRRRLRHGDVPAAGRDEKPQRRVC